MAKGLKMVAARKKNSVIKVLNISQLSKHDNGNLICEFCSAKVQYVSVHKRKHSDSSKTIAAHLKLWPKNEHKKICRNKIIGVADVHVAESKAVENSSLNLKPQKGDTFEVRLNIPIEQRGKTNESSRRNIKSDDSNRIKVGTKYSNTGQQCTPYINSASGVAKIRAEIRASPDHELITQYIKITYNNVPLDWDNFYYEQSRFPELFERLSKNRISHPVALKLIINKVIKNSDDAKCYPWRCQCVGKKIINNGNRLIFIPKLQLANEEFSKQLSPRDTILAVGLAWAEKIDINSIYRAFNIAIFYESQIKLEQD